MDKYNNGFDFKHMSVTSMKMYLRCPLQFMYRYVQGIKMPSRSSLVLGRAIHKGIEENYKQKIESKKDLSVNKVLEAYSSAFDKVQKEEDVDWTGDNPGAIKDSGIGLIKVYQEEIAPNIQPVSVEEGFCLDFTNTSYSLKGYIDLIDENNAIRETKTSKRSYQANSALYDLQLTAYNLAYKHLKGKEPSSLAFDVMVKNKHPKTQTIEAPKRTEVELNRFLQLLGMITKSISAGIFYPCENQQNCGWCGYNTICKKW